MFVRREIFTAPLDQSTIPKKPALGLDPRVEAGLRKEIMLMQKI